jgi:hypothetical protein
LFFNRLFLESKSKKKLSLHIFGLGLLDLILELLGDGLSLWVLTIDYSSSALLGGLLNEFVVSSKFDLLFGF